MDGQIPNQKDYDLNFRPDTYLAFSDREQWVQAIVKGDVLRLLAEHTLDNSFPLPYEPFNFKQSFSNEERIECYT